jgi:hypothetical protein
MNIIPNEFKEYLSNISFSNLGDEDEIKYGEYLKTNFPNCEVIWRIMVVPMTERINGYPNKILKNIGFRENIDSKIKDLSNIHYSLFSNFVYAHIHYEIKLICSLENIFTHLGTCCDLAESFLENWFVIYSYCKGEKSKILQELPEEEFIEIARRWYKESYPSLYNYYFSKGKNIPIRIPSHSSIIGEYLSEKEDILKNFSTVTRVIREYRNIIVHNIRVGKIITPDNIILVPNPEKIQKYKKWESIREAVAFPDTIRTDFSEIWTVAFSQIKALESILNSVWNVVISEFNNEFYNNQKSVLRDFYGFTITEKAKEAIYVVDNQPHVESVGGIEVTKSGVIKSG